MLSRVTKIIQNMGKKSKSVKQTNPGESTTKIETTTLRFILLNVISCFTLMQHEITFDKVHLCKKHEITFHKSTTLTQWVMNAD
jgi:hypothetical protein